VSMLSVEWLPRLISLDLMWFVELAMDNLLWVFAFIAIIFIYNNMKFSYKKFIILFFAIFPFVEFFQSVGIIILVGSFLFVYYVFELILLTFTETVPSLKGKIPFILTIYFFLMITLHGLGIF
jgi:hypothetical protein